MKGVGESITELSVPDTLETDTYGAAADVRGVSVDVFEVSVDVCEVSVDMCEAAADRPGISVDV